MDMVTKKSDVAPDFDSSLPGLGTQPTEATRISA